VSNILTIFNKELKSYFASPIAYGLMAFFALLAGWFYFAGVAIFVQRSAQMQAMGRAFPMDVNEWVVRPVMSNLSVIGLFIIPMIAMRMFAEEKSRGTIELLATSPVRDSEIIIGKWLAATTLWACMLLLSAINLALLFVYGRPDLNPILTGYLGLLLEGGALLAIGAFLSSLTRNQIVAAVGTFAACLLLWVIDWVSIVEPAANWAKVVGYLSITQHFEPFSKGVIALKDALYFVSLIFIGLFLTARSLESLRWRA
jgi:ABC-2 type transport system permease protein